MPLWQDHRQGVTARSRCNEHAERVLLKQIPDRHRIIAFKGAWDNHEPITWKSVEIYGFWRRRTHLMASRMAGAEWKKRSNTSRGRVNDPVNSILNFSHRCGSGIRGANPSSRAMKIAGPIDMRSSHVSMMRPTGCDTNIGRLLRSRGASVVDGRPDCSP